MMTNQLESIDQLRSRRNIRAVDELLPTGKLTPHKIRTAEVACQKYLNALDVEGDDYALTHVYAYVTVGQAYLKIEDWDKALEMSELARSSMRKINSEDHRLITPWVLAFAGNCYALAGDVEKAIRCFQESAQLLGGSERDRVCNIFYSIVLAACQDPKYYQLAMFLCDWIYLLEPTRIDVVVDRYSLMVMNGDREAVVKLAGRAAANNIERVFDAACACCALRRPKSARKHADDGLRLAETITDNAEAELWKSRFNRLLTWKLEYR